MTFREKSALQRAVESTRRLTDRPQARVIPGESQDEELLAFEREQERLDRARGVDRDV